MTAPITTIPSMDTRKRRGVMKFMAMSESGRATLREMLEAQQKALGSLETVCTMEALRLHYGNQRQTIERNIQLLNQALGEVAA